VPATNSATTAPISASPLAIRNPPKKQGSALGMRSRHRIVFDGEIARAWHALRALQRKGWSDGEATGSHTCPGASIFEALGEGAGLAIVPFAARKRIDGGNVVERTLVRSAPWRRLAEGWRVAYARESGGQ